MRKITVYAGFDSFFCEFKISAAGCAQRIKRTITEKAVELFFRQVIMAGKVFAISVLKEFVRKVISVHFYLPYKPGIFLQSFLQNPDSKDNKDGQKTRSDSDLSGQAGIPYRLS